MPMLVFPRARRDGALMLALALGAISLSAGACSSKEPVPAQTAPTPSGPVIQPGRPGEPNATLSGSVAAPVVTPTTNPSDATFFQDMIVHHAQAVVMTESVAGRLTDPQVAALASRIGDEQGPEIDAMARWLEDHRQDIPPQAENPRLGDHKHDGMPGMATDAQMRQLAGAQGVAVDRLFLQLMIKHHQGALTMVTEHAKTGTDDFVTKMSNEISVTQDKQIAQMQQMQRRLT